jgi:hypothetical protein
VGPQRSLTAAALSVNNEVGQKLVDSLSSRAALVRHRRSSAVSSFFLPVVFPNKKTTKQTQFGLCLQRRRAKTNPIKPNFWLWETAALGEAGLR